MRSRSRAWRLSPGASLACALFFAAPAQSAERNNYYAYTDEEGMIHVTNIPERRPGAWKLWKSLEGSGPKDPGSPMRSGSTGEAPLNEARQHRYDRFIRGAAERYQLPESLLRAVIHTESNYHSTAVSSAGAMGLMQLMPKTATTLGVREPFDPQQNIFGGARYLRLLANRYDGDMVLVLAAYNAGAGNVEKYGGVPPFEETRAYVRAVLRRFYAYERQSQLEVSSDRPGPARHLEP